MMIQTRRDFISGLGACLIAAPAIVRVASIMPVKLVNLDWVDRTIWSIDESEGGYLYFLSAFDRCGDWMRADRCLAASYDWRAG